MKISINVIKPLNTTNVKIITDSHDFKCETGLRGKGLRWGGVLSLKKSS